MDTDSLVALAGAGIALAAVLLGGSGVAALTYSVRLRSAIAAYIDLHHKLPDGWEKDAMEALVRARTRQLLAEQSPVVRHLRLLSLLVATGAITTLTVLLVAVARAAPTGELLDESLLVTFPAVAAYMISRYIVSYYRRQALAERDPDSALVPVEDF